MPIGYYPTDYDEFLNKLPSRAVNCLKNEGIKSINDLRKINKKDLLKIPNFGKKSMRELERVIKEQFGIELG